MFLSSWFVFGAILTIVLENTVKKILKALVVYNLDNVKCYLLYLEVFNPDYYLFFNKHLFTLNTKVMFLS